MVVLGQLVARGCAGALTDLELEGEMDTLYCVGVERPGLSFIDLCWPALESPVILTG